MGGSSAAQPRREGMRRRAVTDRYLAGLPPHKSRWATGIRQDGTLTRSSIALADFGVPTPDQGHHANYQQAQYSRTDGNRRGRWNGRQRRYYQTPGTVLSIDVSRSQGINIAARHHSLSRELPPHPITGRAGDRGDPVCAHDHGWVHAVKALGHCPGYSTTVALPPGRRRSGSCPDLPDSR